jgi:hypothetical protein
VASTEGQPGGDERLADELAADLAVVLGQPVVAADLLPRRDGSVAPVIGLLALVESRRSRTACRLAVEWAAAGTISKGKQPLELYAPLDFEFAPLQGNERPLVQGLRLGSSGGASPAEALIRLAETTATLVGGVREAVMIEPGRTEQIPGWVARLRLLARQEELGPGSAAGADLGAWICEVQANASSVYIPDAHPESIWQSQMAGVRSAALAALKEIGQEPPGNLDLHRRSAADFWKAMDRQRCVEFRDGKPSSGSVLQVAMLPRKLGDRIIPGYALLAPE